SRRVVRADVAGTRHPAPATARVGPATVVEGCEAPRRGGDPGPAPRRDPTPTAVAIRSPVGHDVRRAPHVTVGGLIDPFALAVEILVADDLARHVLCRLGVVAAPVAIVRPGFERRARGDPVDVGSQAVETRERALLVGAYAEGFGGAGHFRFAVARADDRAVGLRI